MGYALKKLFNYLIKLPLYNGNGYAIIFYLFTAFPLGLTFG
jgi:hypothetical protein